MDYSDLPKPGALISLKTAQEELRCRICGEAIPVPTGPKGWKKEFGEIVYPVTVVLNFGEEFAHPECLTVLKNWS